MNEIRRAWPERWRHEWADLVLSDKKERPVKRHAKPNRPGSRLSDAELRAATGGSVKIIQQAGKAAIETAKVIDGMPTRGNLELCNPYDPKPWDPCH